MTVVLIFKGNLKGRVPVASESAESQGGQELPPHLESWPRLRGGLQRPSVAVNPASLGTVSSSLQNGVFLSIRHQRKCVRQIKEPKGLSLDLLL